jgi:hypothetical protein
VAWCAGGGAFASLTVSAARTLSSSSLPHVAGYVEARAVATDNEPPHPVLDRLEDRGPEKTNSATGPRRHLSWPGSHLLGRVRGFPIRRCRCLTARWRAACCRRVNCTTRLSPLFPGAIEPEKEFWLLTQRNVTAEWGSSRTCQGIACFRVREPESGGPALRKILAITSGTILRRCLS